MTDVTTDRRSGKLCTTSHGREIIWEGHLCEGANITPPNDRNFLLWTRCGHHDIPADQAHEGDVREVTCGECLVGWEAEHGQFGVGA